MENQLDRSSRSGQSREEKITETFNLSLEIYYSIIRFLDEKEKEGKRITLAQFYSALMTFMEWVRVLIVKKGIEFVVENITDEEVKRAREITDLEKSYQR